MDKTKEKTSRHKTWVIFLFHFLLFAYPLMSLLWRRSYPLLTAEVGTLFLLLAIFCALLTLILNHVRPVIVNVLSPLLITISFMLQFDFLSLGVILCTSLGLLAAWRLRTNFQLYGVPVLIMLIVGGYFDSLENKGYRLFDNNQISPNLKLPPIVHIVLDSFIGIDGLPPYPASEILGNELYTFFENYEFRVFPRAYSRFEATGDSLYSALNFRNESESKFGQEVAGRDEHILRSNSQFELMQDIGYRFSIYQSGHLDFCQSNPDNVDRCWEYPQPNLASIRLIPGVQSKLRMLLKVLVGQSTLLSDPVGSREWMVHLGIANHDPRVFSSLERDLLSKPDGKYFFAHVLLPHGPFAFMHDCSINYASPLWSRYANVVMDTTDVTDIESHDEIYEIRTMKYFEQIDCAVRSVKQIFESMKLEGMYERSIIVVHGDHGSLIGKNRPVYENRKKFTPAEYRVTFSTLFAVKFPGEKERVDYRVLPLSTLLEEFSNAVQAHVSGQGSLVFMQTLPNSPERVEPFVYLQGTSPMWRVDINIFED